MKPLWTLFLTALVILSFQNISSADQVTHKEALEKANNSVEVFANKFLESSYYPSYHFASSVNLMSEPSGLVYFNGQYHLFYRQNPYALEPSKMHIGHSISPDLLHWVNKPFAIAPSETYDESNIFSGSAIIADDILYLMYTGDNVNNVEGYKEIKETQNLALSKDGLNFGKSANNAVIKVAPHFSGMNFSSEKFRSPSVWKHCDKYYALIGSQFQLTKDGAVVLYKSDDLRNWIFVNVTAIGSKGEMGEMWENPQLVKINEDDILLISTEGIKTKDNKFLNKHNSGYFIGKLDYNSGKFKQKGAFELFDYGFDFQAPQVIQTPDGKNVLIALFDIPVDKYPKDSNWAGIMTIPRELTIVDGKMFAKPLKALEKLRIEPVYYKNQKISGEKMFSQIFGSVYELDLQADLSQASKFAVKLRVSQNQETVISYDKETGVLKLNRDKSSESKYNIGGEREVPLKLSNNLLNLQIYVDKSSVEVFVNDGRVVMSSRIYPNDDAVDVIFTSVGDVKLNYLNYYKIKPIR